MIPFARIYEALLAAHGPQHWWPAEDAFEIMLGALLVQRTTWLSAATAIEKLHQAGIGQAEALQHAPLPSIEQCIRGAGFFRAKAGRLRKLAAFVVDRGGTEKIAQENTSELRAQLLLLNGVGPETADAILLYAFGRPVVVIDAYLRRLAQRLTAQREKYSDADLRRSITAEFSGATELNELHALVVAHGKISCTRVPLCSNCAIRSLCQTGNAISDA